MGMSQDCCFSDAAVWSLLQLIFFLLSVPNMLCPKFQTEKVDKIKKAYLKKIN
jgi:hypothetical protein